MAGAEFDAPIIIPNGLVESLYRFADKKEDVNWGAKRASDIPQAQSLVPKICHFLDVNIRKVNYDPRNLRAIIGVSGIDSAVTAWLAAETMQRAQKR